MRPEILICFYFNPFKFVEILKTGNSESLQKLVLTRFDWKPQKMFDMSKLSVGILAVASLCTFFGRFPWCKLLCSYWICGFLRFHTEKLSNKRRAQAKAKKSMRKLKLFFHQRKVPENNQKLSGKNTKQ